MMLTTSIFGLLVLASWCHSFDEEDETREIAKARVESCPGCKLYSLPEVNSFIFEDVPLYINVETEFISGAPPELVFLNANGEELERINLEKYSRKECNQLLRERGFMRPAKIVKAIVESCPRSKLSRLEELRDFIDDDVIIYNNVEVKFLDEVSSPELVLINEDGDEEDRVNLESLTREQCNDWLTDNGITLKMQEYYYEDVWRQSKEEL
ncbi:hypothetical protein PPYR_09409 [Photinus pyralis]|uniref:Selenoprotein M n=1 Tax=Photinus pyralis TaxID=7054 RepID=A0A5N4AM79_PHOPY|nr:selenoprotein M-like [Photinus pyralis]KAB0798416.1 hypothetical protein PPYR_09409 [Photinus pyralis]